MEKSRTWRTVVFSDLGILILLALGTLPQYQRQGNGSALMQPVLSRCDAFSLPAHLETIFASNVRFYEHHGFQVRQIIQLPHSGPKA